MSRLPRPDAVDPFSPMLPARTPGPLGRNDAGDPDVRAWRGDTPGPLGVNDGAAKLASGGSSGSGTSSSSWVRVDLRGLQPRGQALSSLCWLTCYQMIYSWKGLDPGTIEAKLRAGGLDYAAACKRGLLPAEMHSAALSLGLSSFTSGASTSAWELKQRLSFSPIWAAGEWFENALHARLVIGASDDWVEYFDPWYGGTYGMDLQHKDLLDIFIHGDRNKAKGADKLIGMWNWSFWKP